MKKKTKRKHAGTKPDDSNYQITDAELEHLLLILERRNAGKPSLSADFMFSDEEDEDKEPPKKSARRRKPRG